MSKASKVIAALKAASFHAYAGAYHDARNGNLLYVMNAINTAVLKQDANRISFLTVHEWAEELIAQNTMNAAKVADVYANAGVTLSKDRANNIAGHLHTIKFDHLVSPLQLCEEWADQESRNCEVEHA